MKALWFSGGKDSMACLYLNRDKLDSIYVLFLDTGKNYPELMETVAKAKAMSPHWVHIRVDRDAQWSRSGLPSDLVPIDWTKVGQALSGVKSVSVQSYLGCCHENITSPLYLKTLELGCKVAIVGQRGDESHKGPQRNGMTVDGLTYEQPLEDWTKEEVISYLKKEMGEIPAHFALDHSSMDCYDCTAFTGHSFDRVQWMKSKHPLMYQDYRSKLNSLNEAVIVPLRAMQKILELS
jgi:3'-phosphoadenosine 5'-phosphosulfate sulfotransferase (PAPS reductase)/FAD synthetase